jgi:hypothetical protein
MSKRASSLKANNESFKDSKILFFNLKTEPFKVMVTGEKNEEYRNIGDWMDKRLLNKDGTKREYEYVKFVLGMGADKPVFICRFKGFRKVKNIHKKYSTGLEVNFDDERYAVMLGEIVFTDNLGHPFLR